MNLYQIDEYLRINMNNSIWMQHETDNLVIRIPSNSHFCPISGKFSFSNRQTDNICCDSINILQLLINPTTQNKHEIKIQHPLYMLAP